MIKSSSPDHNSIGEIMYSLEFVHIRLGGNQGVIEIHSFKRYYMYGMRTLCKLNQ